jgi:hypothetical protein
MGRENCAVKIFRRNTDLSLQISWFQWWGKTCLFFLLHYALEPFPKDRTRGPSLSFLTLIPFGLSLSWRCRGTRSCSAGSSIDETIFFPWCRWINAFSIKLEPAPCLISKALDVWRRRCNNATRICCVDPSIRWGGVFANPVN